MNSRLVKGIVFTLGIIVLAIGLYHINDIISPKIVTGSYSPTGGGTYRTGQSLGTSDTSIKLSSFKEPVSSIPYTMSYLNSDIEYGTISPQSSISEFVSFSGITQNSDGSATITGVIRGLSRTPGTGGCVASTTLAQAHAGQSIFILSNPPCQLAEYMPLRTTATSTAVQIFSSTSIPRLDIEPTATIWNNATGTSFVTLNKLNSTAIAGASNATAAINGIVQLATALQAASSTITGTTGANDVLWSKYATDTPQNCSTASNGGCVVMSLLTGKLSQAWLDLTASWAFTGAVNIAASVANPLTLNGIAYKLPNTSPASSTALYTNASGVVSFAPVSSFLFSTTSPGVTSGSASSTIINFSIPANTLGTGNNIEIRIPYVLNALLLGTGGGNIFVDVGLGTASTTLTVLSPPADATNASGELDVTIQAAGATNSQKMIVAFTNATTSVPTANTLNTQKITSFSQTSTSNLNFTIVVKDTNGTFSPAFATAFAKYLY